MGPPPPRAPAAASCTVRVHPARPREACQGSVSSSVHGLRPRPGKLAGDVRPGGRVLPAGTPGLPRRAVRRSRRRHRAGRGDRLLEIGCATGKATLPLARRRFRVTCVEPGAQLAAAARRNLSGPGRGDHRTAFRGLAAARTGSSAWSSPRPRGTGSTRLPATPWPGGHYGPAATSPSGTPPTSSPATVTRSSASSRTSTTRSAKGCRRAPSGRARANWRSGRLR